MIEEDWVLRARCREVDPELFFPEGPANTIHMIYRQAVSICSKCEVRQDCYDYAYRNDEKVGIWGGHYASQIQKAKRKVSK